jgi:hypothetical protein
MPLYTCEIQAQSPNISLLRPSLARNNSANRRVQLNLADIVVDHIARISIGIDENGSLVVARADTAHNDIVAVDGERVKCVTGKDENTADELATVIVVGVVVHPVGTVPLSDPVLAARIRVEVDVVEVTGLDSGAESGGGQEDKAEDSGRDHLKIRRVSLCCVFEEFHGYNSP